MKTLRTLGSVFLGLLLAGCGGNSPSTPRSGSTSPASLRVEIHWPVKTARLIPGATQTIDVQVLSQSDNSQVADVSINAPATGQSSTTVTTMPVPIGTFIAKATAKADSSADLAVGSSNPFTTKLGQTANFAVNMDSTIDHIAVADASVSVGSTNQLTATGYDASGATVLISPSALSWSSEQTSIATIDPKSGVVQGVAPGTAMIDVTDAESQKSAKASVSVSLAVSVATLNITPQNPSAQIGQTVQFKVTGIDQNGKPVTLDPSKVTWTAADKNPYGNAYATIDAKSGLATANVPGSASIVVSYPTVGGFGIPITITGLTYLTVQSPSIVGTWTTNYGTTGVETYTFSAGGAVSDTYSGHTYTGHYTYDGKNEITVDNSEIEFGGIFILSWIDKDHCSTTYFDGSSHIWTRQ